MEWRTQDHFPTACKCCSKSLTDAKPHGAPERHQVTEVPPVTAHTTEYLLHALECPCGTVSKAELPRE